MNKNTEKFIANDWSMYENRIEEIKDNRIEEIKDNSTNIEEPSAMQPERRKQQTVKTKENTLIIEDETIDITLLHSKKNIENIIILDSATNLGKEIFKNCESTKSITIPDSVEIIRGKTFQGTKELTIICNRGSYAEKYATKKNIPIIYNQEPQEEFQKTYSSIIERIKKTLPRIEELCMYAEIDQKKAERNPIINLANRLLPKLSELQVCSREIGETEIEEKTLML